MKVDRTTLAIVGWLLACAQAPHASKAPVKASCPSGFTRDFARARKLAWLLEDADAPEAITLTDDLCFGPAPTLGVLAGGQPLMNVEASDEALAARIAHLQIHLQDKLGDGCAVGLRRALLSEEKAHAQEQRLRAALGLHGELQDALDARAEYTKRCTK
jgi:hypothetical protein